MILSKHSILEAFVWLIALTSWVVFVEPSVTDALMFCFILLAFTFYGFKILRGNFALSILILLYIFFEWIAVSNAAINVTSSAVFSVITIYLLIFMYFLSGMLKLNGNKLFTKLMNGWLLAAIFSSVVSILGFLDIIPREYVVKNDDGFRMHGFFKDPNVFGPHLVPAFLYLVAFKGNAINHYFGRIGRYAAVMLIIVALVLSFSRAAYINMVIAIVLFYVMSDWVKNGFGKVFWLAIKLAVVALVLAIMIFQVSVFLNVEDILTSRLTLQEYDSGRFQNMLSAIDVIITEPFGIGPAQYKLMSYNGIHSLYLAVATESGIFCFLIFFTIICASLIRSFVMIFRSGEVSPMYIFAFATLVGVLVNSLVLNTIHWRHLFILMALGFGSYRHLNPQR